MRECYYERRKMKFQPVNRHIWVSVVRDEKPDDHGQILLPEDYKPTQNPYAVCSVNTAAEDCTLNISTGDKIIVENSMINELNYGNETVSIILENYIYGILRD